MVLKFADSKVPVFKESRSRDYIKYGEDNKYPEYLTYLFNKSAKHNAILNGKANYIFGEGYENGDTAVNNMGETLNDIARKCVLDIEVYGGFRVEVVWGYGRKVVELYHVDFTTIRKDKKTGYWWKESWDISNRDEEVFIPEFNPSNPVGSQLYCYNEYRPMSRHYPLPSYIGSNNYIETDIEISKYYLSAIRNGMAPSKMVQFFQGEPSEDKKKEIERRFKNKFTGAENAGQFILVFGNDKNKSVQIDDLSGSDLDKMFVELNKTVQQEIFSGHNITSPSLFGIKTEGQLGGTGELRAAYEIFVNTYAKPKANAFDREFGYVLQHSIFAGEHKLRQTDPIGIVFDVKDIINEIPREFIFEKLGIPYQPVQAAKEAATPTQANDNIKNLTGRQHQQVMRIVRQYSQGKLTEQQAKTLLRAGYGLDDDEINEMLGIEAVQEFSSDFTDDEVVAMFDACGDAKGDYEIIKSKKVAFSREAEADADEAIYIKEAFATYDVTMTENTILELIKKDPKITVDVIAKTIGQTIPFVTAKIDSLVKRGYLEVGAVAVGEDVVTERYVPKEVDIKAPPPGKINPAKISIKYSYEGPQDSRNRPFCAKMMQLDRLYSRAEIERISERLGYSVFDRRGGFWNKNGTVLPHCRHRWQSNIVIKKEK